MVSVNSKQTIFLPYVLSYNIVSDDGTNIVPWQQIER